MPGRSKFRFTPRTVFAVLLALAGYFLLFITAMQAALHVDGGTGLDLEIVLLAPACAAVALSTWLLTFPRKAAIAFLGIGSYVFLAAILVFAIIPSVSVSALSGVPMWLSTLISAALFLVADASEWLEVRRGRFISRTANNSETVK